MLSGMRDRYLTELIETTLKTIERQTHRLDHEAEEDRETLQLILRELRIIAEELEPPVPPPPPPEPVPSPRLHHRHHRRKMKRLRMAIELPDPPTVDQI